jgi:hypothetical protein
MELQVVKKPKWPNITKVTRLSLLFAFVLPSGTPNYG